MLGLLGGLVGGQLVVRDRRSQKAASAAATTAPNPANTPIHQPPDIGAFGANLGTSTPLWVYILREAEVLADGLHLGPVGGRIVAETLLTLISRDETAYLGADPSWRPTLPAAAGDGVFRMTDLLTMAGVDPTSRGQ